MPHLKHASSSSDSLEEDDGSIASITFVGGFRERLGRRGVPEDCELSSAGEMDLLVEVF